MGQKFSSKHRGAPGYRPSPDNFQKFKRMPAPDWTQKMICIIVPNRRTHLLRDRRCAASLHYRNRAKVTLLFLFVNRSPIWIGVRAGGAIDTQFSVNQELIGSRVNIVPRWLFWRNAVLIRAKVTFHWFSSINNPLNSLKPILPLKSRYSVVKEAILHCIQNMKYSADIIPAQYTFL